MKQRICNVKLAVVVLVVPILYGCAAASATKYAPASEANQHRGYSETEIVENTYQVKFRGNEVSNVEQATDYALLRAATVALENNCRYFSIDDMDVTSDNEVYTPSPEPRTMEEVHEDQLLGADLPDQSVFDASAPTSYVTITCVSDTTARAYDAQFIRDQVVTKHGL